MKNYILLILTILLSSFVSAKDGNSFVEGFFKCTVEKYFYMGNGEYGFEGDSTVKIAPIERTEQVIPFLPKQLVIPSHIEHNGYTYKVRSVDQYAFALCEDIEELIISEGVEYIYDGAFYRCSRLRSVSIPSTVKDLSASPFQGCYSLSEIRVDKKNPRFDSRNGCNAIIDTKKNELILGCNTTVIPKGIRRIEGAAFDGYLQLEQVTLPEGIVELGNGAFRNCINLKDIVLPQSLEVLEGGFFGCTKLKSVRIPKNVSKISGEAFFGGCLSLDTIIVDSRNKTYDARGNALVETASNKLIAGFRKSHIVDGIRVIGKAAFAGTMIQEFTIPRSVVRLHEEALTGCGHCIAITVDKDNPVFDSRENCNAIIETATHKLIKGCFQTTIVDDVTEIGAYAFQGACLPGIFAIPESIQKIGKNAFAYCKGLATVFIPASVKDMESFAFYHSSVETVCWKGYIEGIGGYTFAYCNGLYSITLPEGLKNIGQSTFKDCYNLESVSLPSSLEHIYKGAFKNCPCEKIIQREKQTIISNKNYKK